MIIRGVITDFLGQGKGNGWAYSEVPNRRACLLKFFIFSFHPACNFSCNKQKIPPCSFINLLSKKEGRVDFFSNPARLFRSAHLLGTSEYTGALPLTTLFRRI